MGFEYLVWNLVNEYIELMSFEPKSELVVTWISGGKPLKRLVSKSKPVEQQLILLVNEVYVECLFKTEEDYHKN